MSLVKSVGEKGINHKEDVRIVQILLNLNIGSLIPLAFLKEDGGIGKAISVRLPSFKPGLSECRPPPS